MTATGRGNEATDSFADKRESPGAATSEILVMALQFFFDECADEDVARALIAAGVNVVTVTDLGRKGLADEEQLRFATRQSRILYTTDHDYLRLAADFQRRGENFAGIAYHAPATRSKRQIIDALILIDSALQDSEMINRVEYL
jgi:predicted nuclease of predicted toxin-antitoxin system